MANLRPGKGLNHPDVHADSKFVPEERVRQGHVMGESDLLYGMVSGFREGLEVTGSRHKLTALGKKVRGGR